MTKYATTDTARRAAVALLKSGRATLSEVTELAGTSRQLASWWAKQGAADWQVKRKARLAREWSKELAKPLLTPSYPRSLLSDLPTLRRGKK